MVREASEARANAVWPGETWRAEQAHHPEGDASAEASRRIDLNGWTAAAACAHDLISHGVVRSGGGRDGQESEEESPPANSIRRVHRRHADRGWKGLADVRHVADADVLQAHPCRLRVPQRQPDPGERETIEIVRGLVPP